MSTATGGDGDERRLLVRGFPHWLQDSEKKSLLGHFGATDVVVLPTRGKMRNCVFATFSCHEDAKRALGKLHQLKVLQKRLVVEFVQTKNSIIATSQSQEKEEEEEGGEEHTKRHIKEATRHPPPPPLPPPTPLQPRLSYSYPPPSPSTLTNITHTLAAVPKFYEQVLHLMNLMNLPPPFGPATTPLLLPPPGFDVEGGGEERRESEPESEIDSDVEENRPATEREVRTPFVTREVKRRTAHMAPSRGVYPPAKRKPSSSSQPQFDTSSQLTASSRRISLNVPSVILPHPPSDSNVVSMATISAVPSSHQDTKEEEVMEEEQDVEGEGGREIFISSKEIVQNRLSEREMMEMSVFRGYSTGEPSLRLYIKNLSRQTTEQDLRKVYGGYINWSDEREKAAFDVRLMTSGRMKGQAFIGLPSEDIAVRAMRETNGYQLAGRPMVVHFARTAKAKPASSSIS